MQAGVAGVGLLAPGLPGWAASRPILAGQAAWQETAVAPPPSLLLAANERRRAGLPARLALAVAEEAVRQSGLPLDGVRAVFASGNGEAAILDGLLKELAAGETAISPTQFHNSVHNAVAGYWAMGAGSREPVTCLGAHDETLAAALLKALAEVQAAQEPVLCCVYDVPMPEPLRAMQGTEVPFAAALVLVPEPAEETLGRLSGEWLADAALGFEPDSSGWRELARKNPLAALLPLLAGLAAGQPAQAAFGLLGGALAVSFIPCSTAPALLA